jgi:hypothetical protein
MRILVAVVATVAAVFAISYVASLFEIQRLRRLAKEREGDSICLFVRSLDFRRLDARVIRTVFDGLQEMFAFVCPGFPVRSTDDLDQDYRLDPQDVDDLISKFAVKCGRSLEQCENNPYFGRVATVADRIEFLCGQPGRGGPGDPEMGGHRS